MKLSEILLIYMIGRIFAAKTTSSLLGRFSTRFKSLFMGICDHSSRSSFVTSDSDVGQDVVSQVGCQLEDGDDFCCKLDETVSPRGEIDDCSRL